MATQQRQHECALLEGSTAAACVLHAEHLTAVDPIGIGASSAATCVSCITRVRKESQLAAPAKKQSMRRSVRKKLEQQAAAAAAAAASGVTPSANAAAANAANSSSSSSCSSGVRFLSLGLSPLHQMDDSRFQHSSKVRSLFEASFKHGAAYYPFQPLAAAKAKYGAGLHNGR
jgi:hypothetical protein